jgi:nucleoside-diphosphate-sugar epimerase
VVTLSRTARDVPDASTHHVTADARSTPAMHEAIAEVDAVCHLAALVRVRDSAPSTSWQP